MPIDDPISLVQSLDANDERQTSPVTGIAGHFLRIVESLAPTGSAIPIAALRGAADWLGKRRAENRAQLVDVMVDELKYHETQILRLVAEGKEQQRFIADEMPGLILDGLLRAEHTRASDRIHRLGRMLANAAEIGSSDGADVVEDMMAVATALSDLEVRVLQAAVQEFRKESAAHAREAQRAVAARAWLRVPSMIKIAISDDDLISLGSKLDSFGLVARVEQQPWENPLFRPLERGCRFIEYIRGINR
jgi:hypothetical protein